jgi:hypothetical protein
VAERFREVHPENIYANCELADLAVINDLPFAGQRV